MNINRSRSIAIGAIFFLVSVFFGFNIADAAAPFGPQKPAETGFGGEAEAAAVAEWADGSVRQIDGALQVKMDGVISTLNPDDFGGEKGFFWPMMMAMTKDGKELTKEDMEKITNMVIEKYLMNIDNWSKVESLLQTSGVSKEDRLSLQTIFLNSVLSFATVESLQSTLKLTLQVPSGEEVVFRKASGDATSIVGKYDPILKRFVFEPGTYKDGVLIDRETGKPITDTVADDFPLLYRRVYWGKEMGKELVYISGDAKGLSDLDKALNLISSDSNSIIKREYIDNEYVCINFSQDTQKMLEANGIDAYTVGSFGFSGSNGNLSYNYHTMVAIKIGEVRYPDGNIYPTFAVIEPQNGQIIGQLGGIGSQINDALSLVDNPNTIENAYVMKDYVLSRAYTDYQLINIKGSELYTFTSTPDISVSRRGKLYVDDSIAGSTILFPSESISTVNQATKTDIIDGYGSELASGDYYMENCYVWGCESEKVKSISALSSTIESALQNKKLEQINIFDKEGNMVYSRGFND